MGIALGIAPGRGGGGGGWGEGGGGVGRVFDVFASFKNLVGFF